MKFLVLHIGTNNKLEWLHQQLHYQLHVLLFVTHFPGEIFFYTIFSRKINCFIYYYYQYYYFFEIRNFFSTIWLHKISMLKPTKSQQAVVGGASVFILFYLKFGGVGGGGSGAVRRSGTGKVGRWCGIWFFFQC